MIEDLSRRLRAGEPQLAAWVSLPEPRLGELMVREGFDTVIFDMQHGAVDLFTCLEGVQLTALAGKPAIGRIAVDDFASASRLLDGGAAAVIAPMINTAEQARQFASFMKYSPIGSRSWGPQRAATLLGLDMDGYFTSANETHLAIAMIETRAALAAIDDILSVSGIDGLYVGPADLSIALTGKLAPKHPEVDAALSHIVNRTKAHNKFAGLFTYGGSDAKAMIARGFQLCSIATDVVLLRQAVKTELALAR